MWLDAATTDFVLGVCPVVRFVETQIVGTTRSSSTAKWNRVEGRFEPPLVVRVRATQRDGDGYAATVGEDMSLGPKLRAISRIGSCKAPPLGAVMEAISR